MYNQENHIDRLFQEGLKDYSPAAPSARVWDGISSNLARWRPGRWKWVLSIVLIFLCLFVVADYNVLKLKGGAGRQWTAGEHRSSGNTRSQSRTAETAKSGTTKGGGFQQRNEQGSFADSSQQPENSGRMAVKIQNDTQKEMTRENNAKVNHILISNKDQGLFTTGRTAMITKEKQPAGNPADKSYALVNSASDLSEPALAPAATNDDEVLYINDAVAIKAVPSGTRAEEIHSIKTSQADTTENNAAAAVPGTKADLRSFPFILEIFAGPSCSWNTIKASGADADKYSAVRSAQEKEMWSYTAGIEGRFTFYNFFVSTGLNLINYGEKAHYDWNVINGIDTSNSHSELIVISYPDPDNPDNTIIEFHHMWQHVEDTSIGNLKTGSTNRYTYLDIPLMIGYEHVFNKVSARISAGVTLGFLCGADGSVPADDMDGFVELSRAAAPLRKTNLNCMLRLGVSYKISRYTSVFAEPEFRFSPASMYEGDLPANLRYYSTNLHLGINYHF